MVRATWLRSCVLLCASISISACLSSVARGDFSLPDPIIESIKPTGIALTSGPVFVDVYGKNLDPDPTHNHSDYRQYWHFWLRTVPDEGSTGPWTVCSAENGCRLESSSNTTFRLRLDGARWASTPKTHIQMHYWKGLADIYTREPSEVPGPVSHWSKIVTWDVLPPVLPLPTPVIHSIKPQVIAPTSGPFEVDVYGDELDPDPGHVHEDYRQRWHLWVRSTAADGRVGGWMICEVANGCFLRSGGNFSFRLQFDGARWASTLGMKIQMHYWKGLADIYTLEPTDVPGLPGQVSWWSKTVTWEVGKPVGLIPMVVERKSSTEDGVNRGGNDYKNFDVAEADVNVCRTGCINDRTCKAWTFVKPGYQGKVAHCWLKNAVPAPTAHRCCISGVISGKP